MIGPILLIACASLLVADEVPSFEDFNVALPTPLQPSRFFVGSDVIFWKGFSGKDGTARELFSEDAALSSRKIRRADLLWHAGWRTECGMRSVVAGWDVLAEYTWFQTHAVHSLSAPSAGGAIPLLFTDMMTDPGSTADGRWILHYQLLDIELFREIAVAQNFSLSPFFGIRNGWIEQKYAAHFDSAASHTKQTCTGIGPLAGIGAELRFASHLQFFSRVGGSALASRYRIPTQMTRDASSSDTEAATDQISPMLQGSLGLGCTVAPLHLRARVSYEMQYWWNQNLSLDLIGTEFYRLGEDLGLHGATLDLLFDF